MAPPVESKLSESAVRSAIARNTNNDDDDGRATQRACRRVVAMRCIDRWTVLWWIGGMVKKGLRVLHVHSFSFVALWGLKRNKLSCAETESALVHHGGRLVFNMLRNSSDEPVRKCLLG
jgi:hypothetical protein